MSRRFALWRWLLTGLVFWLSILGAQAQAAPPHGYEFMTVLASQSGSAKSSFIRFFPAFQDKSEIQLETISDYSMLAEQASFRRNTELVNQQLSLLTVQGWELMQVMPGSTLSNSSYLFRRARP